MTTTTLLALGCGLAITGGLAVLIRALTPTTTPWSPPWHRITGYSAQYHGQGRRWLLAALAAAVAWWLTGWVVLGVGAAAVVLGAPVLLSSSGAAGKRIDRVEAVADWTRRLADVLSIGVGLEQGITTSARTAPAPITAEVSALVDRINARWPTETALRGFAADLDDGGGDLVVAALILGVRRRGPGLARALTGIADAAAEEVAVRRRIEAERARPRAVARAVTVITLVVLGFGLLNRDYLAPYATPVGQIVLAVIGSGFAGCLWWMHAMTQPTPTPRQLRTTANDPGRATGSATWAGLGFATDDGVRGSG